MLKDGGPRAGTDFFNSPTAATADYKTMSQSTMKPATANTNPFVVHNSMQDRNRQMRSDVKMHNQNMLLQEKIMEQQEEIKQLR